MSPPTRTIASVDLEHLPPAAHILRDMIRSGVGPSLEGIKRYGRAYMTEPVVHAAFEAAFRAPDDTGVIQALVEGLLMATSEHPTWHTQRPPLHGEHIELYVYNVADDGRHSVQHVPCGQVRVDGTGAVTVLPKVGVGDTSPAPPAPPASPGEHWFWRSVTPPLTDQEWLDSLRNP